MLPQLCTFTYILPPFKKEQIYMALIPIWGFNDLMSGHIETVLKFCFRMEQVVLFGYIVHVYKFMNENSQWAVTL